MIQLTQPPEEVKNPVDNLSTGFGLFLTDNEKLRRIEEEAGKPIDKETLKQVADYRKYQDALSDWEEAATETAVKNAGPLAKILMRNTGEAEDKGIVDINKIVEEVKGNAHDKKKILRTVSELSDTADDIIAGRKSIYKYKPAIEKGAVKAAINRVLRKDILTEAKLEQEWSKDGGLKKVLYRAPGYALSALGGGAIGYTLSSRSNRLKNAALGVGLGLVLNYVRRKFYYGDLVKW